MNNLRYISGVSGGTWGSAPYIYLPDADTNFSGVTSLPQNVQLNDIQTTTPGSMQDAATKADIADKCLGNLAIAELEGSPINRIYERSVGAILLNPFGIHSPADATLLQKKTDSAANAQFFTSTADAVADIQKRNPDLKNGFVTMANDMPFLIMNTTMFVPQPGNGNENYICPFEITPLYSGIKAPQAVGNGLDIGGFFVETFGFNTTLNSVNDGVAQASGDYPFELCQPVGASGSALEELLEKYIPKMLGCFPQFNYWNPFNLQQGTHQYDFGDGGCIEDTGITPLLARGVQNIATFLTEPVFFPGTDIVGCAGFAERVFGYNQIAGLFGQPLIDRTQSKNTGQVVYVQPVSNANQVFESNEFQPLLTSLLNTRASGGPMVVSMQMTVVANGVFGITPTTDYQPQVIWSVVDTSTNWANQLPAAVTSWIKSQSSLSDFPEVEVFVQNFGDIIKLTPAQTNLLADFAYWMVMTNENLFKNVLIPASIT
ncbi:hypothetical protein KHS38_01370 [Mucilaginibacter sp. Bleaf8]|uniref:hypothetical protein n=1 Tax=Mucilaginibacter sp. Bleaf8 TaxID=2834430 RepID=UPI001BCE3B52|nr:hypothetical protein [Mucilaginibacter sp. Bleaf8]MBS7563040.1 hypothetical protein [Mucilaginibacter sp. Bleaf8]